MSTIIVLSLSVIIGALANVFLKIGAGRLPAFHLSHLSTYFSKIIANPLLVLGVVLFILNFPLYSFILQKMKLSIAFPLTTSLTILLVIFISIFYLKEGLNTIQYFGIVLLIVSLWLLAK